MACTTILVGKKASYDGSTMIARNDDSSAGSFTPKKWVVVTPDRQPRKYTSVLSHVEIDLPEEPLRYTAVPNAVKGVGIWAAAGVNAANIAMSATETITSNDRVLGADPLVKYIPAELAPDGREQIGGIGEEDLVVLVLPYIRSAREGVERLGKLLETYGTYEMNGIAFQDQDEIWWLESIGGHHWMARRVPDNCYVIMPNQLGIDRFDFTDAFGARKNFMCAPDLLEFVKKNHLDLVMESSESNFDARAAFGSHSDFDHSYNTPRAWALQRYLNPTDSRWDGPDADFTPVSDNIPWCRVPEKKITVEDVKWVLSNHYQGTPYDPYGKYGDLSHRGQYRPIGINRTSFVACLQLRPYVPAEIAAVEWLAFASNAFNTFVPFYANVNLTPAYLADTTGEVDSNNFYWASRLIGALADGDYSRCIPHIEHYQTAVMSQGHELLNRFDGEIGRTLDKEDGNASAAKQVKTIVTRLEDANEVIASMLQKETQTALANVLHTASCDMKNAFGRSDA